MNGLRTRRSGVRITPGAPKDSVTYEQNARKTGYHAYESGWVELLVGAQKVSRLSAQGTFGSAQRVLYFGFRRSDRLFSLIPVHSARVFRTEVVVSTATISSTSASAPRGAAMRKIGRLLHINESYVPNSQPPWTAWRQRCDRSESHRAARSCCGRRTQPGEGGSPSNTASKPACRKW